MNFSLWMALAYAQSERMSRLMLWPLWPCAAAARPGPQAAEPQER
ncbi:hypothetical protein [Pseudorhodoferax aquiterrae]|nr:hypothetical protein [Pseudorhodoferax aquiterrae]